VTALGEGVSNKGTRISEAIGVALIQRGLGQDTDTHKGRTVSEPGLWENEFLQLKSPGRGAMCGCHGELVVSCGL
jgi:hypothetical protein